MRLAIQDCVVTFTSIESRKAAHPMNVNGDVLSDLPEISNFSFRDGLRYRWGHSAFALLA